jgi:hypothetical protein
MRVPPSPPGSSISQAEVVRVAARLRHTGDGQVNTASIPAAAVDQIAARGLFDSDFRTSLHNFPQPLQRRHFPRDGLRVGVCRAVHHRERRFPRDDFADENLTLAVKCRRCTGEDQHKEAGCPRWRATTRNPPKSRIAEAVLADWSSR